MKSHFEIRKATQEDVDSLNVLFDRYRIFYKQTSLPDNSRQFLEDRIKKEDSVIFVACSENQMVGFTQLYPTFSSTRMKKFYILNDLYVDPEFRNQGCGKALLKFAQNFAKEDGVKGLALETAIHNPAQFLYESLGWKKDQEFIHYFWET